MPENEYVKGFQTTQGLKQYDYNALGNLPFQTLDESLRVENGVLSVNTADDAEEDNTLPITSAAVHTQLGNIEILLGTI